MARMHQMAAIAALGLLLTGCVPQEKYTAMKLRADELASALSQAQSSQSVAEAQAQAYKNELDKMQQETQLGNAEGKNSEQRIASLEAENARLQQQYNDALNQGPKIVTVGSALPPQLTSDLNRFAQENPDVVDFDPVRGVVKFKSDVTFASGSTEVSAKAKEVIQQFAGILNSSSASGYELMVVGHTDNARVVNARTINSGNFDNWYLSVHRAIGVAYELVKDGVGKNRLGVAGYADQRPIASNSTDSGRMENRRVEILILPTTAHSSVAESAPRTRAHQAAARLPVDKDSVDAPTQSQIQK